MAASEIDDQIRAARDIFHAGMTREDPWQDWSPLRGLLRARYRRQPNRDDINEILNNDQRFLLTPSSYVYNSRSYAIRLSLLSIAYSDRHKLALTRSDWWRSLFFKRLALAMLPANEKALQADIHTLLADALSWNAKREGNERLMDDACFHASLGLNADPRLSSSTYRARLDTLAEVLQERYRLSHNINDLVRSIDLYGQELELEGSDKLEVSHSLSSSLLLRYNRLGDIEDLRKAVDFGIEALDEQNIPLISFVNRSNNVVRCLTARFKRFQESKDVRQAKSIIHTVMGRLAPSNPLYASVAESLSLLIRASWEVTNSLEDLQAAITILQRAMDSSTASPEAQVGLKVELGILLSARLSRLGNIQDGLAALKNLEEALKFDSVKGLVRAEVLHSLASLHNNLWYATNSVEHLHKAVEWSKAAIACVDAKSHPYSWINASNYYSRLYKIDKSKTEYLSHAIYFVDQALASARRWETSTWAQACASASAVSEEKCWVAHAA